MNTIHPTLIYQNSRLYYDIAKLSCLFNDFLPTLRSPKPKSAPEQEERVWVSASEGAQRVGRYNCTPQPISYEKSGASSVDCVVMPGGMRLACPPSSEPDAGERRVPYFSGTVGRTITGRTRASTALARTRPRWTRIPMD